MQELQILGYQILIHDLAVNWVVAEVKREG